MSDPSIVGETTGQAIACNLCGATAAPVILHKNEWGTHHAIVQCERCGLVYANPRGLTMERDAWFEGSYLTTIERNGRLSPAMEMLYGDTVKRLDAWFHPGRLLDVGCAMGHFMNFARARGWEVCGIEPSRYGAKWGHEHFGLRIHPALTVAEADFPPGYVDAAVILGVIHDLPDPSAAISGIFRILKPGGWITVTTPNFASYRSLLMKEEWSFVRPGGPLWYFTATTLGRMLREAGFAEVTEFTKPASFEQSLETATAADKLVTKDWAVLRNFLENEDADKTVNRRAEGLVVCARKPLSGPPGLRARTREFDGSKLEGKLVQQRANPADRVYYVSGGVRYWAWNPQWIADHGLRMQDIVRVDVLDFLPEGPPLG